MQWSSWDGLLSKCFINRLLQIIYNIWKFDLSKSGQWHCSSFFFIIIIFSSWVTTYTAFRSFTEQNGQYWYNSHAQSFNDAASNSVDWMIMNWKECWRKWSSPNSRHYFSIYLDCQRKLMKYSVRTVGVLAKTEHFLNEHQKCYHFSLLSNWLCILSLCCHLSQLSNWLHAFPLCCLISYLFR